MEKASNVSSLTYIFHHDFNSTWNVLKDLTKTVRMSNLAIDDWATQPVFKKKSRSYEEGSEFEIYHRKFIKMYCKNVEVVETPNYARIIYDISSDTALFPPFYYTKNLFGDGSGAYCTLVCEKIYKEEYRQSEREKEEEVLELYLIFKSIDKCIAEEKVFKTQMEKIEIERNLDSVWSLMVRFKDFCNLVPLICDEVEYEGDSLTEGCKVAFKWTQGRLAQVYLIVKHLCSSANFCVITFESYHSKPAVPQQTIEWRLERLNEHKCLLKLTHVFNEVVKKESLDYTSNVKRKILLDLKEKIEDVSKLESKLM